jgi:hypothetical protein
MFNQQMLASDLDENEMPYAHGLINTVPMPMTPSPVSSLPPLYPSMMTPGLNPQAPFMTPNMVQARYAEGGSVYEDDGSYGLTDMAEMLREQGDEDDTILAHINPEEAHQLGEMYGYDINPITGLPQFGRHKRKGLKGLVRKAAHTIGHAAREVVRAPVMRKVLPIAGALAGNVIAPGIGSVLGGAATKATIAKAQHKDPLKAALRGAALGAGIGYGMPLAGKGLSALGATNLGAGLSQFGGGEYLKGLSSLGQMFTGATAPAAAAGTGLGLKKMAEQGKIQAFLGEKPGAISSLYPGMSEEEATQAGTSLYPAIAKAFPERERQSEGFGLGSLTKNLSNLMLPLGILGTLMRKEKIKQGHGPSFDEIVSRMRTPWRPDQYARPVEAYQRQVRTPTEEEIAAYEDLARPMVTPQFFHPYKHGGYLHGQEGGQADTVPAMLSNGEYVLTADVVSALGDGNNSAGAKKLDSFMAAVRQHKGQKSGLPPKAKSIGAYMKHRKY